MGGLALGCGRAKAGVAEQRLQSKIADERRLAAFELGALGEAAAPAAPRLAEALDDADRNVRFWSLHALGQIGPGAGAQAPRVAKLLGSKERDLRDLALGVLVRLGAPGAASLALELGAADRERRARAAAALAGMGEGAEAVLRAGLRDKDHRVRYWSAWAAGKDEGLRAALASELSATTRTDGHPDVRLAAAQALDAR